MSTKGLLLPAISENTAILTEQNVATTILLWKNETFDSKMYEQHQIFLPAQIQKASPKRQEEYFYGRYCARQTLKKILPNFNSPIDTKNDRSPAWPVGITGSISHTNGIAACMCGRMADILAIGIDVEIIINPDMFQPILEIAVNHAEAELPELKHWQQDEKLTLIFSAKESLFKALSPITGKFFGFEYASLVAIDEKNGSFTLNLEKSINEAWPIDSKITGRFIKDAKDKTHKYILTYIIINKNQSM